MTSPRSLRSRLRPATVSDRRPGVAAVVLALSIVVGGSACTGEEAVPIDPANPPTTLPDLTGVTHLIEPTAQMREAAEGQCLLDDRAEGYIEAVDPNTGAVLSSITVDCDEVRARDDG